MVERTSRSFPKAHRLLRRQDFLKIREEGKGFTDGPLAASWRPSGPADAPPEPGPLQIEQPRARVGITVSSRVGGSVERNRVKRRLREAVRLEWDVLPAVELSIVARASALTASVETFRAWLRRAARRMEKTRSGPASPAPRKEP